MVFIEILQNSRKIAVSEFLFIKKETLAQVLSCEFYEISKNNFSYRTPSAAASVDRSLKRICSLLYAPCRYTTSFQRRHDVVRTLMPGGNKKVTDT